jgi:uncharacterized protein GlcG (DUF336 family)
MQWRSLVILGLLPLALASGAHAQVVERPTLTLDAAKRVMAAAEAEMRRQDFPASVAIVDDGGNLLLMERYGDWTAASARVAIGKARTAAIFRRSTNDFENIIKNGRTAMVALEDFTPLQGGLPIVHNGRVVGAIGVSGNSPPKDEEIAQVGLAALTGASTAAAPSNGTAALPVSYFGKDRVAASFAGGAVLLNGDGGQNYEIHTSRRTAAGMAEIHARDTDVIYVTGGSATFVTGGSVVDGRNAAENEVRGSSIRGGETRTLVPGDVVVVPAGVPHWFQRVTAPFTYYVVKVR